MTTNTQSAAKEVDQKARGIHAVVDQASSTAHNAVDKAVGVADSAAEWLSVRSNSVKEAPRKLIGKSTDYVAANPWKSLGIAVVAGILISKIM